MNQVIRSTVKEVGTLYHVVENSLLPQGFFFFLSSLLPIFVVQVLAWNDEPQFCYFARHLSFLCHRYRTGDKTKEKADGHRPHHLLLFVFLLMSVGKNKPRPSSSLATNGGGGLTSPPATDQPTINNQNENEEKFDCCMGHQLVVPPD